MSSFSASFPTSWAVDADGNHHPHSPQRAPLAPPRSPSPLPLHTLNQHTTTSNPPLAGDSKYLTHFPPSWVFSPSTSSSQSQPAAPPSTKEHAYRSTNAFMSQPLSGSTFYSEMTLRPRLPQTNTSLDTHQWPGHGEDLKEKLLTRLSQSSQSSQSALQKRPRRRSMDSTQQGKGRSAPIQRPKQPQTQISPVPARTFTWDDGSSRSERSLQRYDGESDGSGLGDVPYRLFDFADTYSVATTTSAFPK